MGGLACVRLCGVVYVLKLRTYVNTVPWYVRHEAGSISRKAGSHLVQSSRRKIRQPPNMCHSLGPSKRILATALLLLISQPCVNSFVVRPALPAAATHLTAAKSADESKVILGTMAKAKESRKTTRPWHSFARLVEWEEIKTL